MFHLNVAEDFNKEIINTLGDYGVIAKPIYLSRTLLSYLSSLRNYDAEIKMDLRQGRDRRLQLTISQSLTQTQ